MPDRLPPLTALRAFENDPARYALVITDMEMPGMTYTVIANGDDKIGGFPPMAAEAPRWLPYVTVDDVDARVEKAKALGATIAGDPMTVPGVGRMATLIDPVGGVIALITYEAPAEG